MKTETIKVESSAAGGLGRFRSDQDRENGSKKSQSQQQKGDESHHHHSFQRLKTWEVSSSEESRSAIAPIRRAAEYLRRSDTPVGFPTETVYGLGADATRSAAVKGIYAAKGRPSDNPLIVHVCDLDMLRGLLRPSPPSSRGGAASKAESLVINGVVGGGGGGGSSTTNSLLHALGGRQEQAAEEADEEKDPIPSIYYPLIQRFWPGPLTILLRSPPDSALAPEVTAGLPTFGARMPDSPLALTLIKLAGAPLAAPSANASTRPSPTTARHVLDDLDGRLELILDGGACAVGVESTVVDGLCDPPAVLRPGGVSIEELRECVGWEGVQKAYRDAAELGGCGKGGGGAAPRAPGMKYKHYSPRAKVVLYEDGFGGEGVWDYMRELRKRGESSPSATQSDDLTVGIIRTRCQGSAGAAESTPKTAQEADLEQGAERGGYVVSSYELPVGKKEEEEGQNGSALGAPQQQHTHRRKIRILDIDLGHDVKAVAQGLFSALRELDTRGADLICIEGVGDGDDLAAAVMNRLRKAASEIR